MRQHVLTVIFSIAVFFTFTAFGDNGRTLLSKKQLIPDAQMEEFALRLNNTNLSETDRLDLEQQLGGVPTNMEIYQLEQPLLDLDNFDFQNSNNRSLTERVDEFIIVGKKIIDLVSEGEPVRTLSTDTLSVLPFEFKDGEYNILETENWRSPVGRSYQIVYKNLYGIAVVDFTFSVGSSYGGSHQGKGRYLHGIYASPKNLLLRWGFDFDAKSELETVTNLGTKENPVVGATMVLKYEVSNILNSSYREERFLITGRGDIQYLP